ncbi:hypothetical protein L1887_55157 [Cichorium endivia]|nr:hypothetical protein L1887_55157 [Cichorium endivia]
MHHGEPSLANHDGALRIAGGDLGERGERVVEERKEEHAAAREEARGVLGHLVEDRAGDECLEDAGERDDELGGEVAPDDLCSPLDGQSDLHGERDDVGAALARVLCLFLARHLLVVLDGLVVDTLAELFEVRLDLFVVLLALGRVLPVARHLVGRARCTILEAFARLAAEHVGTGDQIVGGGLTVVRHVTHLGKVVGGVGGGAKVDLLALVDDEHLVEELGEALARLVDRGDGGGVGDVGGDTKRLDKLERGARVETTRGIVEERDLCARRKGLCDADPLALAARDAADEIVSDLGVVGVPEAEDGGEHLDDGLDVALARVGVLAFEKVESATCLGRAGWRRRRRASARRSDALEEGGATCTGATEDKEHLSGLDAALKVVDDGLDGRVEDGLEVLDSFKRLEREGANGIANSVAGAEAGDGEVLPDQAHLAALEVGTLCLVHDMAEEALELKVAVLVKGVEAECGLSAVGGAGAGAERVLGEATGEFGGAFRVERSKGDAATTALGALDGRHGRRGLIGAAVVGGIVRVTSDRGGCIGGSSVGGGGGAGAGSVAVTLAHRCCCDGGRRLRSVAVCLHGCARWSGWPH